MDKQRQMQFLYLFERVGEPLYFSPRGTGQNATMYTVPTSTIPCREVQDASQVTRSAFSGSTTKTVQVQAPSRMPDLSNVARMCPRSSLYNYFNAQHRAATRELRQLFLNQTSLDQLLSMACVCRDSPMVNCKLWINAFASAMLFHPQTKQFQLPAIWEVSPDNFFSSFTMRQAFRQAELPERDRGIITVNNAQTGRNVNPENRLAYFREDVAINSHHWHWHLIYRLDDPPSAGRRKGELFFYMHHSMLARYDAERLGNGLPRVRPLTLEDNPTIKEGYFSKLFDTNSGQNWGTRQNNTPLRSINRADDTTLLPNHRVISIESVRKWRDRVMEAIDTGFVQRPNGERVPLTIDMLGDMIEASTLSPNPQFYGPDGLHNVGHILIAYSHDPEFKHVENSGPMADTTTAMRDPVFYRWHKYIDMLFDMYKQTKQPYQDQGGEFPLSWSNITITNVSVQSTAFGSQPNRLETYFMESNVDLSRGLDFTRTDENRLGAIWLRFTHLNHDPFNYTITVRNRNSGQVRATVRIFLGPRLNEHNEQFVLSQQRKLFFEMDKFVETLRPGDNTITRRSTDSSVSIPWEQTFRDLERSVLEPTPEQSVCGCGWPQHMLLPRGSPAGQIFDLVVLLTNADEDSVRGQGATPANPTRNSNGQVCRESISFCGRLGQPYPDSKPMGYPFDRNPYSIQNPSDPTGPQIPVETIEQYVSRIPNMSTIQVRVVHNSKRMETRQDGGPGRNGSTREINGDPMFAPSAPMCPDQGQKPSGSSSNSTSSASTPRPRPVQTGPKPSTPGSGSSSPSSSPTTSRPTWGNSISSSNNNTQWGSGGSRNRWYGQRSRPGSPQSPPGWTRVSRPGSPNWGWNG